VKIRVSSLWTICVSVCLTLCLRASRQMEVRTYNFAHIYFQIHCETLRIDINTQVQFHPYLHKYRPEQLLGNHNFTYKKAQTIL
jgi:hypothetical protein